MIALEDVGIANLEVLQRILKAKSEGRSRAPGHSWHTHVELTRELARSQHSQAICDVLLRVQNDPAFALTVDRQAEGEAAEWAKTIFDRSAALEDSAAAALSFGGLFGSTGPNDPLAVFEIAEENPEIASVAHVAKSAWRASRNPMALLLPLVWQRSKGWCDRNLKDDDLEPTELINGVPAYAFDQFTRVGKAALRQAVSRDLELQEILTRAGVRPSEWAHATGDLIFLIEGGLCARRVTWTEAEELRQPARWLPIVARLESELRPAMQHLASNPRLVNEMRQHLFQRAQ